MKMLLKDANELNYWKQADLEYHRAKMSVYLWAFGHYNNPQSILEIGPGPLGGVLPLIGRPHRLNGASDKRRVGVDPLASEYRNAGLLVNDSSIEMVTAYFEHWKNSDRFDAIFAIDSLDHGSMGFHLLPKIADLLNPFGRLFLHVHLRPTARLDENHDHSLTIEQFESNLAKSRMTELFRRIYPIDVDGQFGCPALVSVCEKQ
jgi:cyclopropane fatty-acyl-phospholipid synthase-like methyltransferase